MTQAIDGIEGFLSQRSFQQGLSMWQEERLSRDSRYDEWTNEQSLNMISTDGDSTGRKAEMMIMNELKSMGYGCEIGNGREACDVYLDSGEGIEVKSARPSTSKQYVFGGIQKKSKITIFMFIRKEGLQCCVANTIELCRWANKYYTYIIQGKKSGYSIPFHAYTYKNKNMQGYDILRPLTKKNIEWALGRKP